MAAMDPQEKAGSAPVQIARQVLLIGLLISSVLIPSMSFASSTLQDSARGERAKTEVSSQPNSEITAIDKSRRVINAKVIGDGQRFQFTPTSDTDLRNLIVGQGLLANFETGQVFVDAGHLAGRITTKGLEKSPSANGLPNKSVVPVWNKAIITDIDSTTGNVTARDSLTHKLFQFKAANVAIFSQLRLRQTVLVNFPGRQVTFDGKAAVGAVTKLPE